MERGRARASGTAAGPVAATPGLVSGRYGRPCTRVTRWSRLFALGWGATPSRSVELWYSASNPTQGPLVWTAMPGR